MRRIEVLNIRYIYHIHFSNTWTNLKIKNLLINIIDVINGNVAFVPSGNWAILQILRSFYPRYLRNMRKWNYYRSRGWIRSQSTRKNYQLGRKAIRDCPRFCLAAVHIWCDPTRKLFSSTAARISDRCSSPYFDNRTRKCGADIGWSSEEFGIWWSLNRLRGSSSGWDWSNPSRTSGSYLCPLEILWKIGGVDKFWHRTCIVDWNTLTWWLCRCDRSPLRSSGTWCTDETIAATARKLWFWTWTDPWLLSPCCSLSKCRTSRESRRIEWKRCLWRTRQIHPLRLGENKILKLAGSSGTSSPSAKVEDRKLHK